MDMGAMKGSGAMSQGANAMQGATQGADPAMAGNAMDMKGAAMDHGGRGMEGSGTAMGAMKGSGGGMAGKTGSGPRKILHPSDFSTKPVHHPASEFGPQSAMHAQAPAYRLDDPGVGLRNNGRRVLTYADLFNLKVSPARRDPDREIELHLTGNMHRYMWSINGIKFADSEPLRWRLGEQVRITFVNDTMMNHPMHLHGMWSDLETGDNDYLPRKHTVIVQPGSRISYRVIVDAEGSWAYHCHLLYHMLGMFRTVTVS